MRKIILKILLATFPVLIILGLYFYEDPFKVLYHYDSYFAKDGLQVVVLNKDMVTTRSFINHYPQYHYDSYIFGSSRSMYYHIDDWKKHINSDRCFHFDASGETLYGIERKFNLLYERHIPIKNALIIFDEYCASTTQDQPNGLIFRKDPLLTKSSEIDFQASYLKAFFDVSFLGDYIHYLITHKGTDKLSLNNVPAHYEVATNEVSFPDFDALIARNRDSFYSTRLKMFNKRDTVQKYAPLTLKEDQLKLLNNIKKILDANNTSYKIAISPIYDQVKFNKDDLQTMYSIFGKENVYDFSGINELTESMYNYYDNNHYRPVIATRIMDSIYGINGGTR